MNKGHPQQHDGPPMDSIRTLPTAVNYLAWECNPIGCEPEAHQFTTLAISFTSHRQHLFVLSPFPLHYKSSHPDHFVLVEVYICGFLRASLAVYYSFLCEYRSTSLVLFILSFLSLLVLPIDISILSLGPQHRSRTLQVLSGSRRSVMEFSIDLSSNSFRLPCRKACSLTRSLLHMNPDTFNEYQCISKRGIALHFKCAAFRLSHFHRYLSHCCPNTFPIYSFFAYRLFFIYIWHVSFHDPGATELFHVHKEKKNLNKKIGHSFFWRSFFSV